MKTLVRAALAAAVVALATFCFTTAAGADPVAAEADFLGRINRLRSEHGVVPLAADPQMVDVARRWSAEMARQQQLSHNPNVKAEIENWRIIGENVGVGSDVTTLERAFEDSPRHRENMMNSTYTHAGIGVVEVDGQMWVTEVFKQPRTTAAAATAAPAAPQPTAAPRVRSTTPPQPAKPRAVAAPTARAPRAAPPTTLIPTTTVPAPAPAPLPLAAPAPEQAPQPALAAPASGGGTRAAGAAVLVAATLLGGVVAATRRPFLALLGSP